MGRLKGGKNNWTEEQREAHRQKMRDFHAKRKALGIPYSKRVTRPEMKAQMAERLKQNIANHVPPPPPVLSGNALLVHKQLEKFSYNLNEAGVLLPFKVFAEYLARVNPPSTALLCALDDLYSARKHIMGEHG